MIKVIASFVSSLFALLLGILALATDYWKVWWTEAKEISATQYYHEGLFDSCYEIIINDTIMTSDTCSRLHDIGRPGEYMEMSPFIYRLSGSIFMLFDLSFVEIGIEGI